MSFTEDDLIELGFLRSQEIDLLVDNGFLSSELRTADDTGLDPLVFNHPELKITILRSQSYPAEQLCLDFENLSLPRLVMDALRADLRKIVETDAQVNNFERWSKRGTESDYGIFECEWTALKVAQRAAEHLTAHRNQKPVLASKNSAPPSDGGYRNPFTPMNKNYNIPQPGIDVSEIVEDVTAASVLGMTPAQICSQIPEEFRVLHVESIIRQDLYRAFLARQSKLRITLQRDQTSLLKNCTSHVWMHKNRPDRNEMIDHLLKPKLTFHGTENPFVPSIVRHGFLCPDDINPETGEANSVRCGSTYGRGIYTSPSAEFSLAYSGDNAAPTTPNGFWGLKLIVCATIMGRTARICRDDKWRMQNKPWEGADSHVDFTGNEYIVFDKAQVLPCYVIHLDWGNDNAKYFQSIPSNPSAWNPLSLEQMSLGKYQAPGDKQRMKEALAAKAAKYLPYGFDATSGTKSKIEDVAEVDEDEEDYGDFQNDRIDGPKTKGSIWEGDERLTMVAREDEYVLEKLTKLKGLSIQNQIDDGDD